MKKAICLAIVLLMFGTVTNASEIDKLLELKEEQIDIANAAFIFAKEFYPDLDVNVYSAKVDDLANRARLLTNGSKDPEQRIRALNSFLYQIEGFSYDRSPSADSKIENRLLHGLLDTKKGTCANMPVLYLAVAQRLGYPVYPVAVPDHLILRYVDPLLSNQNIEATSGGGYAPDEKYIRDFNINRVALHKGAYLRTMTRRQFLADLLAENAVNHGMRGKTDKAINYLEKAVTINPTFPDYYESLRILYLRKSKQVGLNEVEKYRQLAKKNFIKAEELGYVVLARQ